MTTSNRISTNGQALFSLNLMLAKQRDLANTYQQISTGQKLLTGADDPLNAGKAVQMDRTLGRLDQYDDNGSVLLSRLNQQESVLTHAGDVLSRVRELTIQANSASLSDDDRKSVSSEVRSLYDQLLALSNSDDGAGRYLFGGTKDANAPFSLSGAGGSVSYNGDQTQRKVEIASGLQVADTVPGSEVFMRVRTGNGLAEATADTANTGTAVLLDYGVTDSGAWNKGSFNVVFTAATTYEVRDTSGNVLDSGSYKDGDTIAYNGTQLRIEGTPASGDQFHFGPSGTRDVFSTLTNLLGALNTTATTDAQRAAQQNVLQSSLRDINVAQQHFIDARAMGGAGQSAIDDAANLNEARSIATNTNLSNIRDLDYAEALSRYSLENTALQAAQKVFSQIQQMSLFKLI